MAEDNQSTSTVELATELTIAWLSNPNNRVSADEVPAFLERMHSTVTRLASGQTSAPEQQSEGSEGFTPAVSVRKSLASPNHIISMIDGKPYTSLKRHLSRHGLTPEQYRERYNLKGDYPMVAPAYSERRRALAHQIGLGSKGRKKAEPAAEAPKRSRKAAAPSE